MRCIQRESAIFTAACPPPLRAAQVCEESGTDLAQEVLKQVRKKAREAAKAVVSDSDKGTAQAVGKIVGSLCVVSAKKGDAESAMLASWVSQASFNPPGLTVAVKKERAIESLVQQGGKFTLNVLAEGKEKARARAQERGWWALPPQVVSACGCLGAFWVACCPLACAKPPPVPLFQPPQTVFKALSKEFAPGESRFGDLETQARALNDKTPEPAALAACFPTTQ